MLKKNIPGAIFICLILFTFVGIGFYLGISLDWAQYFKYLAVVAIIAVIISAIINTVPSGSSKK
ncbi:MAG: hypothetical protein DHS20C13_08020 [Thermodesulfobacteriota bacterium]|nr:MAG: hypothetical protein DHS20C13_08020 [Thermodesulfobacteriota bacterium]